MSKVVLKAQSRTNTGSGAARRIRRNGRVPGILYGRSGKALTLDLDYKDFSAGIKGISESTIIKMELDDKPLEVFVKNTQRNILDGKIIHVDFYEVESGVALRAKVSIILKGNPIGVREGGILEFPLHEIEVECLPKDLPERIELDVSGLGANHSITVKDIPLAEGIRVLTGGDNVVALVKYAKEAAAPAADAGTTAAAAAPAAADKDAKDSKDSKDSKKS